MITEKTVRPGPRSGSVRIPASKSRAHRLMILSALSDNPVKLGCSGFSNDILATAECLNALGAGLEPDIESGCISVTPFDTAGPAYSSLPCRDSGSTLRFLLPLAGALGRSVCFEMEGRLPERPLAPFDSELESHGMRLRREGTRLYCEGQLQPGRYTLPGNVSSQYISGLLMSLPLLGGDSELHITGTIESSDYIRMTEDALKLANIRFSYDNQIYRIPGSQKFHMPGLTEVEGDWSGAAFFLCLGALSPEGILVQGVNPDSLQGDKAIIDVLKSFGAEVFFREQGISVKNAPLRGITVDAAGIPDLIPVISVVAAAAGGTTRIINAGRLRLKESDRLKTTAQLLTDLGVKVTEGTDSLTIEGCGAINGVLTGGAVNSFDDHRIAMSAAVAAAICREPVIIGNPECVKKSFADFWEVYDSLSTFLI